MPTFKDKQVGMFLYLPVVSTVFTANY